MLKIALKNRIKHNLIRFTALLLLSVIGVSAVTAGISFPSLLKSTVNRYVSQTNFWDVHVLSTLGFSSEDISSVSSIEGVTRVMPVLSTESSVSVNNNGSYKAYIAATDFKTLSLSSAGFVASLTLTEGSYPLNSTGCVVVKSGALKNSVVIGDQIKLTSANDDLSETTFTVTGIATSPSMLSDKGNIVLPDAQIAIYINDGAFKDKASYDEMLVKVTDGGARNVFSSKLQKNVTLVKESVAKLATDLELKRTEELSGEYDKNVDKAQKQYDYIKEDSEKKLSELSETVKRAGERLAAEQKNVEAQQSEVDALKKEFEGETEEIEQLRKKEELTEEEKEKIEKYDEKVAAFNKAEGELDAVKATLELNSATYQSLQSEYEILKKLSEQKLKDAENTLNAAKNNEQITDAQIWKISDITDDEGYISLKRGINGASVMLSVAALLVFAVVICILVLVTASKQDKDISIFVRHGYTEAEIKNIDNIICLAGVLLGGIIGILIGSLWFSDLAFSVFGANYSLPEIKVGFPHYSGFAALLIAMAAVLLAIYKMPQKKEITTNTLYIETVERINKYLTVGSRLILRNAFGNIKTLVFNIIVTAVITALITAVLSSGIAVNDVVARQNNIQRYNLTAAVNMPDYTSNTALTDCLNNKEIINNYAAVTAKKLKLDNGKGIDLNVYSLTDSADLRQVLNLKGKSCSEILPDSVIIGQNTAKKNNIKIGDDLPILTSSGTVTLKVTGICNNYIDNYVYIGHLIYETYFANEGFLPLLLIDASATLNAMSGLLTSGAVYEVDRIFDSASNTTALNSTLKAVMTVGIIVLAFLLVVYNLMLLSADGAKRGKELRALKLNGKNVFAANVYVFADMVIKNLLGTVLGVLLGVIMFILVLTFINSNTVMYSTLVEWRAVLWSAVISVFAVPISVLIYSKNKKTSA